jgi:hypothetical protein
MSWKIFMICIICTLFFGLALAETIEKGRVYSQSELDEIADGIRFNPITSFAGIKKDDYMIKFDINTLKKVQNGYKGTTTTQKVSFKLKDYNNCVTKKGTDKCNEKFNQQLQTQATQIFNQQRQR